MSLTKQDLAAIKSLIDDSIDSRVPKIVDERIERKVQPMLDILELRLTKRLTKKIDNKADSLALQVGQFSLETTNNFNKLNKRIDNLRIIDSPLV